MATDKKPIILSLDDDPQVLKSLRRDLRNVFKDTYRVISTESANDALNSLTEFKKRVKQ